MKVFYVFLLVLVFGVVSSHGRTNEYFSAAAPSTTFSPIPNDEFLLVQQWPASFCSLTTAKCPHNIPPYFTVHGLWAQSNHHSVNCKGEKRFDPSKVLYVSQIEQYSCMLLLSSFFIYVYNLAFINIYIFWQINPDMKSNLETHWPNLKGKNQDFWRHEYDKHASCISLFQDDQVSYFSSTLRLAKEHNVTNMLSNLGSTYLYRQRLYP